MPTIIKKEDITCHNYFAQEHTRWVEDYLLKNSNKSLFKKLKSNSFKNSLHLAYTSR